MKRHAFTSNTKPMITAAIVLTCLAALGGYVLGSKLGQIPGEEEDPEHITTEAISDNTVPDNTVAATNLIEKTYTPATIERQKSKYTIDDIKTAISDNYIATGDLEYGTVKFGKTRNGAFLEFTYKDNLGYSAIYVLKDTVYVFNSADVKPKAFTDGLGIVPANTPGFKTVSAQFPIDYRNITENKDFGSYFLKINGPVSLSDEGSEEISGAKYDLVKATPEDEDDYHSYMFYISDGKCGYMTHPILGNGTLLSVTQTDNDFALPEWTNDTTEVDPASGLYKAIELISSISTAASV